MEQPHTLDPNKRYGRFDRPDPYVQLPGDSLWDRIIELHAKAEAETRYEYARESHLAMALNHTNCLVREALEWLDEELYDLLSQH